MATKSKKRKRSISTANPRSYSQLYKDDTQKPEKPSPAATKTREKEVSSDETVNWSEEYGYVVRDLRLLLIVSVLIFAAMIGAGLII